MDQEGGRVQRLGPPTGRFIPAERFGVLYEIEPALGWRGPIGGAG